MAFPFLPVLAGAGAGLLGGLFKRRQARKMAPIVPDIRLQDPTGFREFGEARQLLGQLGGPETTAGLFEREAFQPFRAQAQAELRERTIPGIREAFAGRGLGRSTLAGATESRALAQMARDLASARAGLRVRGLERGFTERARRLAGIQSLLGTRVGAERSRANLALQLAGIRIPQEIAQREARADIFPTALTTGGAVLGGIGQWQMSQALRELLGRLGRTAITPTG